MTDNYKKICKLELVLYIFIIIFGLYFKSTTPDNYKWVIQHYRDTMYLYPTVLDRFLSGIRLFNLDDQSGGAALIFKNGVMNTIAFAPFGALVYQLSDRKKFTRVVGSSLVFSSLIEIVQLLTVIGGFGIKDIIANSIGGLLGACIMALFSRIELEDKHKKALMIGISSVTAVALVYLTVNALMHLDVYIGILTRNV